MYVKAKHITLFCIKTNPNQYKIETK